MPAGWFNVSLVNGVINFVSIATGFFNSSVKVPACVRVVVI